MPAEPPILELSRRWPRPYRSTWVFFGFLAVVLALLNVPGQEVVEPVMASSSGSGHSSYFSTWSLLHHGWPMTTVRRDMIDFESPGVWNVTGDIVSVDISAIIVDVGVAIGILLLGGFLFQTWRTRRGSWRQFRLAELLLVVVFVAIGVQRFAAARAAARAERSALETLQGSSEDSWLDFGVQPTGPTWLRQLLGGFPFADRDRVVLIEVRGTEIRTALPLQRLQVIRIYDTVTTAELELLSGFPDLVALDLRFALGEPSEVHGEADLPLSIPRLENLRGLNLYATRFYGDGLENVPRLEVLDLSHTFMVVTHKCLEKLLRMRNLRILNLHTAWLSRAGVDRLADLPHLEELTLSGHDYDQEETRITDGWIPSLSRFRHLRHLSLSRTNITPEGFESLRAALPDCEIQEL